MWGGGGEEEVIKTVKKRLHKDREERVANSEENTKESVTVIYDYGDKAGMIGQDDPDDWTYADHNTIFGGEDEVILRYILIILIPCVPRWWC